MRRESPETRIHPATGVELVSRAEYLGWRISLGRVAGMASREVGPPTERRDELEHEENATATITTTRSTRARRIHPSQLRSGRSLHATPFRDSGFRGAGDVRGPRDAARFAPRAR